MAGIEGRPGAGDGGDRDRGHRRAGPVEQYTDLGLVICIGRHRQQDALAEVYRRHGGSVHDLASRVGGPIRGDEVVREVLLELWRQPGRFDPDRSTLRGHLLARAHALAVGPDRTGRPGRPDSAALADRVGDQAWGTLSTLPAEERDAIALAYFCGLDRSQVAGALGQPRARVTAWMRTGLVALAGRLGLARGRRPAGPASS